MKKILSMGVALALALGFASCNKDKGNSPDPQRQEGTTYMSVSLSASGALRADSPREDDKHNSIGDWGGRDKIENVHVYIVSEGNSEVQRVEMYKNIPADFGTNGVWQAKAWKTTPGPKMVYVVVNNGGEIKNTLDAAKAEEFEDKYNEAFDMLQDGKFKTEYAKVEGDKDIILMSGVPAMAAIAKDVKEEDAYNHATNNVKLNVRRIASRVTVTMNKELKDKEADGIAVEATRKIANGTSEKKVIGHLKNLKWSVAQYEKKSFLAANNYLADKVMSWKYDFVTQVLPVPNYNMEPNTGAGAFYDYSRLKESFDIKGFSRTQNDNKANVNAIVGTNMQFITETTHKYGKKLGGGDDTGYRRGNTTYVMVTGTFEPTEDAFAKDEYKAYKEKVEKKETVDIYWGTIDGLFYSNLDKAKEANKRASAKEGADGVITYKAGKMYYFAWVNPDKLQPTEWVNSPVVRNNIYHINISGFAKLGFSGNPYNPDPKNPDPKDPDDPTPDPEDPIYDRETYMTTEITVINWGMHSYDITF
ncbi:Mfa1 family fimbria major subunit [Porphyromonas levii]|uniref:Minor fimbrium subunit Mfa1 C-terminal domain-containing protein n=1 Tax=Porphyromonas levii TaxID=28114 RepID=A0A4Y8WNE0_9PORP|nr:Mfa1 family fimbria major subunit [Porphyromonas levii]TFH94305.1 hypothetical protein E4P47_08090 [Porphyromonas levii]TFH97540.1 hypothetical protein E4P48_01080 [Porphyromonas levii]